jgi:serine/threonine protein kinase
VDNFLAANQVSLPLPGMEWTVPGYRPERLLGLGASGEVWAARELVTGRRVALKRVRVGCSLGDLRSEAEILASFRHPHVVALHGVLAVANGVVLVLDLAEGGSFAELSRRRGVLPPAEVAMLCAPLAEALACAHHAELVHGDISPGNLLLDSTARPVIADLGTARFLGMPGPTRRQGTVGYIDPAVVSGLEPVPASDVYGLAAVMVELLTGEPPDSAGGFPALTVPPELARLLEHGLRAEPSRRPSAAEFGERLRVLSTELVRFDLDRAVTNELPRDPVRVPVIPCWRRCWAVPHRVLSRRASQNTNPDQNTNPVRKGSHRRPGAYRLAGLRGIGACLALVSAVVLGWNWARPENSAAEVRPAKAQSMTVTPLPASPAPMTSASAAPVPAGSAPASSASSATDVSSGRLDSSRLLRLVGELDRAREVAFASADPSPLSGTYAPGSAALKADDAALAGLRRAGLVATGVRHETTRLKVLVVSGERALVEVTQVMAEYQLRKPGGEMWKTIPAGEPRTVCLDLVPVAGQWRIAGVTRVRSQHE